MKILIAYDVSVVHEKGSRRLRRVARACEDYAQRVQYSLFEATVGDREWAILRERLLSEMDPKADSLRFYFLDADAQMEHHGAKEPTDLEGPLIV